MIAALQIVQRRILLQPALFHGFDIEIVDIDQQPALERVWGDKVPVLLVEDAGNDLTNDAADDTKTEICHYFLDETTLLARLSVTFQ